MPPASVTSCGAVPGSADRAFADPRRRGPPGCEIVNQNDPPTNITLSPSTVAENEPVGTVVGQLSATDPTRATRTVPAGVRRRRRPTTARSRSTAEACGPRPSSTSRPTTSCRSGSAPPTGGRDVRQDPHGHGHRRVRERRPGGRRRHVTTPEDTPLVLPVTGAGSPAANDTDADGDPLTVTAVSGASRRHGHDHGRDDPVHPDRQPVWAGGRTASTTPSPTATAAPTSAGSRSTSPASRTTRRRRTTRPPSPRTPPPPRSTCWPTTPTPTAARCPIASVTQPANGTVVITGGGTGLTYAARRRTTATTRPADAPDTFTYTLTPAARPRPSR